MFSKFPLKCSTSAFKRLARGVLCSVFKGLKRQQSIDWYLLWILNSSEKCGSPHTLRKSKLAGNEETAYDVRTALG